MNQTKEVLFGILQSELKQMPSEEGIGRLLDENGWIEVYRLAKSHDLAHIIGKSVQSGKAGVASDSKVYPPFIAEYNKAVFRYATQQNELSRISDLFEREAISHIPLKGSVLRQYYPDPFMRSSCDIDILIHTEQLDKAVNVLKEQLNYTVKERWQHDISLFSPGKVHIELHFGLIEYDSKVESILANVWEEAQPESGRKYRYTMSAEQFVFYHVAHMAKHFVHGGCGVRPFIDLWVIENKFPYDREAVEKMLASCSLLTFYKQSLRLSAVWFDGKEGNDVSRSMEEYLLFGGAFGTKENRAQVAQAKLGSKRKRLFSRLFLKYDLLKLQYPVLQKYKFLMPVYQVRRWFSFLKRAGLKGANKEIKLNVTSGGKDLSSLLSDLGIKDSELI